MYSTQKKKKTTLFKTYISPGNEKKIIPQWVNSNISSSISIKSYTIYTMIVHYEPD